MNITLENITKRFGSFVAVDQISFSIPEGKLVALLGPSGCGKTTLLRMIAGLETPDEGKIYFADQDITSHSVNSRQVGFVFQHYALFKHMTIFDNIAFGLDIKPKKSKPSPLEIKQKVHELLNLVQLDWTADRYPSQLSGGQRQRVALARALAIEPKILLLDEPFGALDAKIRKELRRWLKRLHDEMQITSIFVTHDQEEALEVADILVVINKGKIEQIGTPDEIFNQPASPFVYHFIGSVNLFHGRVHQGLANLGGMEMEVPHFDQADNLSATAYVRPHDIQIEKNYTDNGGIYAQVKHIFVYGSVAKIEVKRLDNNEIVEAEISYERFHDLQLKQGDKVSLYLKKWSIFPSSQPVEIEYNI